MCLAFTIHCALLGEEGMKRLAALNHEAAVKLADRLAKVPGVELVTPHFFNEFTLRLKSLPPRLSMRSRKRACSAACARRAFCLTTRRWRTFSSSPPPK